MAFCRDFWVLHFLRWLPEFFLISFSLCLSICITLSISLEFILTISFSISPYLPHYLSRFQEPSFSLYVYNLYFTFLASLSIFISLKSISMPAINPISLYLFSDLYITFVLSLKSRFYTHHPGSRCLTCESCVFRYLLLPKLANLCFSGLASKERFLQAEASLKPNSSLTPCVERWANIYFRNKPVCKHLMLANKGMSVKSTEHRGNFEVPLNADHAMGVTWQLFNWR